MKKAIVTGSNGFIGTALCCELSSQGVEVIAVVRSVEENTEAIEDLPNLRVVYCDMSRFGELDTVIPDRDADIFYHLAWVGTSGPLRGDDGVQMDNIRYTCEAVKSCKSLQCGRFVFASSIMEYEIDAIMKSERTPGKNTLYSSGKVAADYFARTIAGSLGIQYLRTVISNIYGPGEMSPRLINTSLRKLLDREHCAFSAGDQMYDFIYITDAAKAFTAVGEKGKANKTYYIGSLSPRPLKEFLCEMRDQVDASIDIGLGEIPFDGVSLTYQEFDIGAVREDTGFVPEVSFGEGVRNTVDWMRECQNP